MSDNAKQNDEQNVSKPEESGEPQTKTQGEQFTFGAEIQKLLDILIHSLYTHKEIFLRELISNAADALDKVRFAMLTQKDLRDEKLPLEITINLDKDQKILTITDTGIGMTREELIENIGTIAHSGSLSFLKTISQTENSEAKIDLIGQFGVGFYSVFMAAKRVEISTLSASPSASPCLWSSEGSGSYNIGSTEKTKRGTEIKVFLQDDAQEFLEPERIKSVIRRYSDFVSHPIKLDQEQINKLSAIWHRPAAEIKAEEYKEFFSYLTHMQEEPLTHLHLSFDAPLQFTSILFIPRSVPWDLQMEIPEKWRGIHLYAKRVFIQSDCEELMPRYLRFVRGVVDSDDLPLNISRETLQENNLITKIRKNLVRKVLDRLAEISVDEEDDYKLLWKNFGKFIKQGYREDYGNREKLTELFRFNSSRCSDQEELISLKQYQERMPEGQEQIYYLSGENRETIETSPHLEIFKRKGLEVLYLTEPVDDFLMTDLTEFAGKKIVSIDQEDISLEGIEDKQQESEKTEDDEAKETVETSEKEMEDLLGFFKNTLQDKVSDVRFSKRLIGSPCCLVAGKDAPSLGMQKILKLMHDQYEMPKRILEINKDHALIRKMAKIYAADPREEMLSGTCRQLFDNALLLEGSPLDTRDMVPRLQKMMESAFDLLTKFGEQKQE